MASPPIMSRRSPAHDVRDIAADDVVRLRDHGVDAEFVGELRQLGYGPLPVDA